MFLGLIPQTKSAPEVIVYYNKNAQSDEINSNNFNNMELISGADVYLKRCVDDIADVNYNDTSILNF